MLARQISPKIPGCSRCPFDDFTDLGRKLRLDHHFVGVGHTQVGVNVASAFFNLYHHIFPLARAGNIRRRQQFRFRKGQAKNFMKAPPAAKSEITRRGGRQNTSQER
jgi:hypothetical protein